MCSKLSSCNLISDGFNIRSYNKTLVCIFYDMPEKHDLNSLLHQVLISLLQLWSFFYWYNYKVFISSILNKLIGTIMSGGFSFFVSSSHDLHQKCFGKTVGSIIPFYSTQNIKFEMPNKVEFGSLD